MVTAAFSDNDSDSPMTAQARAPLAAWKIDDDDNIEKDQTDHKFDLSILFNFAPRDGKGYGSGFDDDCSLNIFATGTSQLTAKIGTFNEPNFQITEEEVVDSAEPPAESVPNSTTGVASNVSEITSVSSPGSTTGATSVASAPTRLGSRPSSPTSSSHSLSDDDHSHAADNAASLRKTGVNPCND